jgi:hypothetical protein
MVAATFVSIEVGNYDTTIAHYVQSASVQGDQSRHDFARKFTRLNETTLMEAAVLGYGAGRLTHSPTPWCSRRTRESLPSTA